jgi:hypothetical protein
MSEKTWDLDSLLGPSEKQIKKVSWPGRPDKLVGLKILSDDALRECDERVRAWASRTGIVYDSLNMLKNSEYLYAWASEVVAESLCDPETGQRLCKDAKQLTTSHRRDIIQILFVKYSEFTKDTVPNDPDKVTQEVWDGLLEQIKKEQSVEAQKNLLTEYDSSSLVSLIVYMVNQQSKSVG